MGAILAGLGEGSVALCAARGSPLDLRSMFFEPRAASPE